MGWRVVVVASNAKVDYKMDYLVIRSLESTKRVHLSEIDVLMLESTAISITAYAVMDTAFCCQPLTGKLQRQAILPHWECSMIIHLMLII